MRAYIAAIEKNPKPGYVPNCDKAGFYDKEQCDTEKSKSNIKVCNQQTITATTYG